MACRGHRAAKNCLVFKETKPTPYILSQMNPVHPSTSFPAKRNFHILPSTTRSRTRPLFPRCQTVILYYIFHLSHSCDIFRLAHHPWFYHPKSIRRITITTFFVVHFFPPPVRYLSRRLPYCSVFKFGQSVFFVLLWAMEWGAKFPINMKQQINSILFLVSEVL
jgi:hypothetical protein